MMMQSDAAPLAQANRQASRGTALAPWGGMVAVLILLPVLFPGTAMISTLNYLGIMAIFALSYNVMLGQTGLLSLGHGTFFGLGGFFAVHLVLHLSDAGVAFPLPLVPLIGGLGAYVLALFGGWLASGRGGMPFAMITLGLGELVHSAAALFPSIYGSEEGISIDRTELGPLLGFDFGPQVQIYAIVAFWFAVSCLALWHLTRTPMGLLQNAVRDNAERVEFLGFSGRRVRLSAYAIAGGFAGLAGGLAALNFEIMTVNELGPMQSTLVLLMTYIGGTRLFLGPVLGAVVIGLMKIWLSDITPAWQLYFGLLFIFVVMVAPGGLSGMVVSGLQLLRAGGLRRQAPLLAATGLSGAAVAAGLVMLIELGYRIGLDAALGPDLTVFGLALNTARGLDWALAVALVAAGIAGLRAVLPRLADLRHQMGFRDGGRA